MHVSNQFTDKIEFVLDGYKAIIHSSGVHTYQISYTGQYNPDDNTICYNYELFDLSDSDKKSVSLTTNDAGMVLLVEGRKLSRSEANALSLEGMYVPELWIEK